MPERANIAMAFATDVSDRFERMELLDPETPERPTVVSPVRADLLLVGRGHGRLKVGWIRRSRTGAGQAVAGGGAITDAGRRPAARAMPAEASPSTPQPSQSEVALTE
jgi:hypothetical protein